VERGLVSTIIPTYNRAATIQRAVDSVLAQDYPRIEVIVVDDGSVDDTAERMAERYGHDGRVRYLSFPNGGVCVARNRGLRSTQGEYVAMLDSDDCWLPGKLALQVGILEAHPELSMVWSDMDAIDTDGQVVPRAYLRQMYGCYQYFPAPLDLFEAEEMTNDGVPYYIGRISQALVLGNLVHTSTVVARADRLAQAGEFDQSVHPSEDQDYYYRLCRTGPVALIDAVTIHYQIGAADAASGYSRHYELATSSLKVFTRLHGRERSTLRLPREAVEHAKDELYRWVGISSFRRRRMAEARQYLAKRIARRPSDMRSFAYLALSCSPFAMPLFRALRVVLGRGRF